jgi:plastocyanin
MSSLARLAAPAVAVITLAAAGCGTGSDLNAQARSSSDPTAPLATGTVHVVMQSLSFSPASLHGKVGQTVRWLNEDSSPHNVLYVSGPRFASSSILHAEGGKFSIRLAKAGTIHYYCSIHPWMKATIVVSG